MSKSMKSGKKYRRGSAKLSIRESSSISKVKSLELWKEKLKLIKFKGHLTTFKLP